MKMGIVLCDQQHPYQIPMGGIEKFIADEKPQIKLELGDFLDCRALNGWARRAPEDIDWNDLRLEIGEGNRTLDSMDAWLPDGCEKHFWFGNHEERLAKFRAKNKHSSFWIKNRGSIPYIMLDLKLRERGYKTHAQNEIYKFGKLHFFHGDNYSTWHTAKNLAAYGESLCYGHVHSPQRFTTVSPINQAYRSAWSLGCLCDRNPEWKNGSPNAWVNGFAIFYLRDDGNFNLYQIDIVKGAFVAPSGKLYKV